MTEPQRAAARLKVDILMRDEWIAEGYLRAVRRFIGAEERGGEPNAVGMSLSISLLEAGTWLAILDDRVKLGNDADVRAMRFIRDRTHHQAASAIRLEHETSQWLWQHSAFLPRPTEDRHAKDRDVPAYERLQGRPVREVLERLAVRVEEIRRGAA